MSETNNLRECRICSCEFDLQAEGGIDGSIGILPCAFCPTCLNGIRDMVEQLWPCEHCEDITLESDDDS